MNGRKLEHGVLALAPRRQVSAMARKEVRERLRDRPASAAARSRKRRDPVDLGSQRSEFTALRSHIQLVTDFRWIWYVDPLDPQCPKQLSGLDPDSEEMRSNADRKVNWDSDRLHVTDD